MMDFWFTAFVFAVAILGALGASLLLVGYVGTLPAAFAFGWRNWLPALVVPVLGPIWFAWQQRRDFARPGLQLVVGLGLLVLAAALLYGYGPYFVDRMAQGVKPR